jgi:hypothetical protein
MSTSCADSLVIVVLGIYEIAHIHIYVCIHKCEIIDEYVYHHISIHMHVYIYI